MMQIVQQAMLATAVAALSTSCANPASSVPHCVPGASIQCGCTTGGAGAQACLENGTFGACACSPSSQPSTPLPSAAAIGTGRPAAAPADLRAVDWQNHRYRIDDRWIDVRRGRARLGRDAYVVLVDTQFADLTGDGAEEVVVLLESTSCADDCDSVPTREGLDISHLIRVYASRPGESEPHFMGTATVVDGDMRVASMRVQNRQIVITGEPDFGLDRIVFAVRDDQVVEVERR